MKIKEILHCKQPYAPYPNLKPTLKSISLRLPESMLDELRQLANERDIRYQSLIKHFLRERIDQEYQVKKGWLENCVSQIPAGSIRLGEQYSR